MKESMSSKLTAKEKRFVEEYPIDFNATQALIRAGYRAKNENVASVLAARLLGKVRVSQEIAKRMDALTAKADAQLERIVLGAKRIAFADPRLLINEDGSMKALKDLPDDIAFAIAGVECEEKIVAGVKTVTWKYRLDNRNQGLDKLFRYHALYKDPGTKDNPLTMNLNWGTMPIDELARIRKNPELALAQRN